MTLHLIPEIKELVEMDFKDKFAITETIINRRLRGGINNLCATFSGGMDSQVVLFLILKHQRQIPVIFNNTGIEYPETLKHVRYITKLWNLNLIQTTPDKNFWSIVEQYGFPQGKHGTTKHPGSRRCCYWLKDRPMLNVLVQNKLEGYFTGVTASENRTRMFVARDKGTCYRTTKNVLKIHPILYWTREEVINFAKENNIPLNPLYERGAARIGCSCCTAFMDWEKQLSTLNPKLYKIVKQRKSEIESRLTA